MKKSVLLLAVISIFISFPAAGEKIKLFQFEGDFFRETGTNDFANGLDLPTAPLIAADVITSGSPRALDVGLFLLESLSVKKAVHPPWSGGV